MFEEKKSEEFTKEEMYEDIKSLLGTIESTLSDEYCDSIFNENSMRGYDSLEIAIKYGITRENLFEKDYNSKSVNLDDFKIVQQMESLIEDENVLSIIKNAVDVGIKPSDELLILSIRDYLGVDKFNKLVGKNDEEKVKTFVKEYLKNE